MNLLLLSVLLANAPDHGIYGGFNLQWVEPSSTPRLGMVALTVGAAVVDGVTVTNGGPHAAPSFPNNSTEITPWVPLPGLGLNYVAYCYIVNAGFNTGNIWFQNANFDFVCEAGVPPTQDGHPMAPGLTYPPGVGAPAFTSAIFVGSVVGTNVAANSLNPGNNYAGFSVQPFFRNGSKVIYGTNATCNPGGVHNCWGRHMSSNWEKGLPQNVFVGGDVGFTTPATSDIDYTIDGANSVVPLSASQLIYDVQAVNHQNDGESTLCFLDPNHPAVGANNGQVRSCQSELLVDGNTTSINQFFPVNPYRAQVNIGKSTRMGTPFGEVWFGGATSNGGTTMMYADFSYRGYVEPERQLVPQLLP